MARGACKVTSLNGALTVNFTAASGATPVVYSDEALTTAVSLPATVADGASTKFFFASQGSYTLSVKTSGGTEIAGDTNAPRVITVFPGETAAVAYDTRLLATVSGDTGRSTAATASSGTGGATPVTTVSAAGASQTFALGTSGLGAWDVTLTAATLTPTFSGATAAEECIWTLYLRQDATGGRLVSWSGITWVGGVAPTLTTTPGAVDTVWIVSDDGGTTKWGYYEGSAGIPSTIVTAKGDLIVGTASGAVTNKAVGSNGQVLTADSTSGGGIKWAAAPAPAAPLVLTGSSDAIQLKVLENATQTADALQITASDGSTVKFRVTSGGNVSGSNFYTGQLGWTTAAGAPTSGQTFHSSVGGSGANAYLALVESSVAERVDIYKGGDVVLNAAGAALATNATQGFTQLPNMAGTPSGTPARSVTGNTPVVIDTTGSKLWAFIGGAWKSATLA